jgi:ketosteroid isomerase-like protein
MLNNEKLIQDFYTAFQKKDFVYMQSLYDDDASFFDPVFRELNAQQVKAMWEMLIHAGKDLRIEFFDVKANEFEGSATWMAYYTFSRSGKKVVNRIKAKFKFKDGKIIEHKDQFDLYVWAKQAMGFTGFCLGWTSFFQNKISQTALKNLDKFMAKTKSAGV